MYIAYISLKRKKGVMRSPSFGYNILFQNEN